MKHLVLLMDEEYELASKLEAAFKDEGIELRVEKKGKPGVQAAWRDLPSAIVLRVELSDTNGFAICNILKKNPRLREIPLVLLSDTTSQEVFDSHSRLQTRADFYFSSPITAKKVMEAIKARLDETGETREETRRRLEYIDAREPSTGVPAAVFMIGVLLIIAVLLYFLMVR